MHLILSKTSKVRDIKEAFHSAFPYLKLEFVKKRNRKGKDVLIDDLTSDETLLIDMLGSDSQDGIEITSTQSVGDVEQMFQQQFKLPVLIFRKMGTVWIETSETNKLSLEKQNQIGEEAVSLIKSSRGNF
jgi:hypothetical protein